MACRMDDLFSISVHHGSYFTKNPKKYMRDEVDVVDNCDPNKWSKVEIEGICRDFGYTSISRLWNIMPGMDQERANFHLVVDDDDVMYMTELVKGHEEIHVYMQPLVVKQDLMGYYSDYNDESDDDDYDEGEFYSFYDSDDMYANDQTFNNEDEPNKVDVEQVYVRRVGAEPIIEEVNADVSIKVATSSMWVQGE